MTAAPTRMTHRPSTWPSSAADRSASACCSSSCCRCPPAAAAAQLAAVRTAGAPRPGGAYQDDLRSNLLNIPAGNMSALADERLDFVDWLRRRIPPGWPATGGRRDRSGRFPAPAAVRRLHGRRLRAGARAGAKPGRDAGTRARARRRRHAAGQRTRAGIGGIGAALCGAPRGVVQRQPALARLPALAAAPGYFNSPYPVSELAAGIAADATVCVIGTSLSAVDAVVALQQAGHRGPLICVSRNGRLPSVRSPHNRPPPRA